MYKPYKMHDGMWAVYNTEVMYPKLIGEYFSWDQAYEAARRLNAALKAEKGY